MIKLTIISIYLVIYTCETAITKSMEKAKTLYHILIYPQSRKQIMTQKTWHCILLQILYKYYAAIFDFNITEGGSWVGLLIIIIKLLKLYVIMMK